LLFAELERLSRVERMTGKPCNRAAFQLSNTACSVLLIGILSLLVPSIATSEPEHAKRVQPTPPKIPSAHPRLYVLPSDLAELRKKTHDPQFAQEWTVIRYSRTRPVANALHHLLVPGATDPQTGEDKCDLAIRESLDALAKVSEKKNVQILFMKEFHQAAIVYDWCYANLSAEQKQKFISNFKRLASGYDSPGYPAPATSPAIVGHQAQGALLGNQLAAGIAIYNEDPTMYDAAARVLLDRYRKVSDFLFPGIMDLAGTYYARHDHFITANWMFRKLGLMNAFNPGLARMPYEWIYGLRSDGRMLSSGDIVDDEYRSRMYRYVFTMVGAYYKDPLLLWMGEVDTRDRPPLDWRKTEWNQFFRLSPAMLALKFILVPSGMKEWALKEGPERLKHLPPVLYGPPPAGRMIFRTGWTSFSEGIRSRDVIVDMKIGEYFIGNHQRKDFGTFQIYYRGPLAIADGVYQGAQAPYGSSHWANYYHQTVSTNGLLIFDPKEKQYLWGDRANDGGETWPNHGKDHPPDLATLLDPANGYHMGKVTAHAADHNGRYGYIAGDITKAYSEKVEKVQRAMLAIKTNNPRYPAVVIVADHVRSSNPSFEKSFLLHSTDEPTISDRTVTIVNRRHTYGGGKLPRAGIYAGNYGGKLVLQNLLPLDARLRKVEGHTIRGVDYPATKPNANGEEGWGRVEIYSSGRKSTDFLDVMTVMDSTTTDTTVATRIENDNLIGARILNTAALFGKEGRPLPDKTRVSLEGSGRLNVFIGDLRPGEWQLLAAGRVVASTTVSAEAGSAYFAKVPAGDYLLSRKASQTN
jgi:heparin/heparan-sulfate lyase